MIVAGMDVGLMNLKVAILEENRLLSSVVLPEEGPVNVVAERAIELAAAKAGASGKNMNSLMITGSGREYVRLEGKKIPESLALAVGVSMMAPGVHTLVDLGAEKTLVLKCSNGLAMSTASNDKCAAGTGRFVEIAAEVLSVSLKELGTLALRSTGRVEIINTCAVFAESEIISLLHSGVPAEDISMGVFRGVASRIYPLMVRVGLQREVGLVGGLAGSKGMVRALEERLGYQVVVPENPEVIGAMGAAALAFKEL